MIAVSVPVEMSWDQKIKGQSQDSQNPIGLIHTSPLVDLFSEPRSNISANLLKINIISMDSKGDCTRV
jgi:hypothetical protein